MCQGVICMKPLAKRISSVEGSAIRRMVGKSYGLDNVISFAFGEPDFVTPQHIIQAGIKAMEEGRTFYTPNAGIPELRDAIAASYGPRGMQYGRDNVIVTVGGCEALLLSVLTLLDPGDEVIISNPYWANYNGFVSEMYATPVLVDVYEKNDFMFDPADIEKAITPRTKAILMNFPSNPTGGLATRENLEAIARLAIQHDLYVITDEMYRRLIYTDETFVSIAEIPGMKERTIIVDGFSKAYAMTGWRVGFAVANEEIIKGMTKMQENAVSSVFEPVQRAALAALKGSQQPVADMLEHYRARRQLMLEGLNTMMHGKITCREPKGAFYMFPNITGTGLSSEEFSNRLLDEKHVVTVPGTGFGSNGEGFIRLSYATSEANIREGLKRIQEFVEAL